MYTIRKTREYRFWLQKVVKIWIWNYFIDGWPPNCVSFHFLMIFGQIFFMVRSHGFDGPRLWPLSNALSTMPIALPPSDDSKSIFIGCVNQNIFEKVDPLDRNFDSFSRDLPSKYSINDCCSWDTRCILWKVRVPDRKRL